MKRKTQRYRKAGQSWVREMHPDTLWGWNQSHLLRCICLREVQGLWALAAAPSASASAAPSLPEGLSPCSGCAGGSAAVWQNGESNKSSLREKKNEVKSWTFGSWFQRLPEIPNISLEAILIWQKNIKRSCFDFSQPILPVTIIQPFLRVRK